MEHVDPAAGKKRRDDFEGGIFGRRADQPDESVFDGVEQRVLLGLVEPVDFVDEEDGPSFPPSSGAPAAFSSTSRTSLTPGGHRVQLVEIRPSVARDDARERRLPRPRGAPEDHGRHPVLLDEHPEGLAGTEKVFLSDETVQR